MTHQVSIADSLTAYTDRVEGARCRVAVWADQLPDGELDMLRPHLVHGKIRPMFDYLKRDGVQLPFSATSWERHWTGVGRCSCDNQPTDDDRTTL